MLWYSQTTKRYTLLLAVFFTTTLINYNLLGKLYLLKSDAVEKMKYGELPIYLIQSTTNQTSQTTWGKLAQEWNTATQYDDILNFAKPSTLPLFKQVTPLRVVTLIHCGPKTGSTTLRFACKVNYRKTCNIPFGPRTPNKGHPVGYMNETALYPLIRQCRNTSHFCAKEIIMPIEEPKYENVMFIHMFPFRQFDDWAKSALKERFIKKRNKGCYVAKSLIENCTVNIPHYELDFGKYGKTQLSRFKEEVVQRMREMSEHHIFLLYHHRELHSILGKLQNTYNIPLLPKSDGKRKAKRPEGTCKDEINLLKMFHNCFSSELMNLA